MSRSPSTSTSHSHGSSDSTIFKVGHLKKKGTWGKWKEGWYEITNGVLYHYASQRDLLTANNEYKLQHVVVHAAESITGLKCTFMIILDDKKNLFFQANSQEDCLEWIHSIEKCSKIEQGKNSSLNSRFLLEAFNDAVVLTDESANILNMNNNATELFGYKLEEVIGKSVSIFMNPHMGSHHTKYVDKYNATGEKRLIGKPRKMRAVTKDGKELRIILSLGEMNDDGVKRYIATMKDITEEEKSVSVLTNDVNKKIETLCLDFKEKIADVIRSDESLKQKLEELKEENKALKNQNRELTSQLQIERGTRTIISNALYSVIRVGLIGTKPTDTGFEIAKRLIDEHAEQLTNPNTIFREDSETMRKLIGILNLEGAAYLLFTLERPIQKLLSLKDELIPFHAAKYTNIFLEAILTSEDLVPKLMKDLFNYIKELMIKKGWNDYNVVIGTLLILRFVNPALISPTKYFTSIESINDSISKMLVTISKILIAISTGATSQAEDTPPSVNDFITEKRPIFFEFIQKITGGKQMS